MFADYVQTAHDTYFGCELIPWVLLLSGVLQFFQSAPQSSAQVTEVKQELQGSVLRHGEYSILKEKGGTTIENTFKVLTTPLCFCAALPSDQFLTAIVLTVALTKYPNQS